jgi:hypothetical protein
VGAMDGEMHRPMALAMVALLSLSYGSYGCWKGRRASCSHSIWKKGKQAEREREVDACVLPLACCRCINLLQARRAAAGELGARGQLGVASGGSARGGRRNRLSIVFWAGPIGI